jgi:hypothetical protein
MSTKASAGLLSIQKKLALPYYNDGVLLLNTLLVEDIYKK